MAECNNCEIKMGMLMLKLIIQGFGKAKNCIFKEFEKYPYEKSENYYVSH